MYLSNFFNINDNVEVSTNNGSKYNGYITFIKGNTFTLSYYDSFFGKIDKVTFEGYKPINANKYRNNSLNIDLDCIKKDARGEIIGSISINWDKLRG